MKKIITIILLTATVIFCFPAQSFAADDLPVAVSAKACILIDGESGKVLLKKNENERLYPASVTKIMTMLLVTEAIDSGKISLEDSVSAGRDAVSKGGSQIWLKEGETMSVDELLKATAVYSANDACAALAELVGGSEDAFITMMNERAAELGMKNTNFENCTGLDDTAENHKTTAYDIALMAKELMKHETIKKYTTIWMDSLRNGQTQLVNTNKLVRFYKGCSGLKTGTTSKAGCCICATATRDNMSLIAVVLGSPDSNSRFNDAKALLNYGFANWCSVTPVLEKNLITPVNIKMGREKSITPEYPEKISILIPKGKEKDIRQKVNLNLEVQAPVESGQTLGTVDVTLDGEKIAQYNLTAPHYVERTSFLFVLKELFSAFSK